MLPSMTKAVHPIAAAVTAIVIVGQWCCRKARIGMQTYGFHIELTNGFSMRATACAVTSIAPARRWSVLFLLRRVMTRLAQSGHPEMSAISSEVKAAWYEAYCAVAEAMQQGERQAKAAGEVLSPGSDRKGDG